MGNKNTCVRDESFYERLYTLELKLFQTERDLITLNQTVDKLKANNISQRTKESVDKVKSVVTQDNRSSAGHECANDEFQYRIRLPSTHKQNRPQSSLFLPKYDQNK